MKTSKNNLSNSIWKKTAAFMPLVLLLGVGVMSALLPDVDISGTERRHLKNMPEFSVKTLANGSYMTDLEEYFKDHLAGRDGFRTAKAELETSVFEKKDVGGYFRTKDGIYKLETELSEKNVVRAAEKFSMIAEKYFPQSAIYVSVIPDKNDYIPAEEGYPCLDYGRIEKLMQETMPDAEYISLYESLETADYYRTDPHWRQECIGDVADLLIRTMTGDEVDNAVPGVDMSENSLQPEREASEQIHTASETFLGGYAGASAFRAEPEPLCYVTNTAIENAVVYDYEKQKTVDMYAWEKLDGTDPYDFYLWGARALLTMENPVRKNLPQVLPEKELLPEEEASERSLIVFRDSFGSSIAPLLLKGYDRITLVDLRYVTMDYAVTLLGDTDYDDVLFLYSGSVLNHSNSMKF